MEDKGEIKMPGENTDAGTSTRTCTRTMLYETCNSAYVQLYTHNYIHKTDQLTWAAKSTLIFEKDVECKCSYFSLPGTGQGFSLRTTILVQGYDST